MERTTIRRAHFRPLPNGVRRRLGTAAAASQLVIRAAPLIKPRREPWPLELRAEWEDLLLAGGFVEAAASAGVEPVANLRTDLSEIDVKWLPVQRAPARAPTLDRYLGRLRTAAVKEGARVLELRALSPGPVGVAITVQSTDPARYLERNSANLLATLERHPPVVDGTYAAVLDRRGNLVWALGRLPGRGSYYVLPDFDECDRIEHSQLVGSPDPPPCPA
jgi:hypothetical protein